MHSAGWSPAQLCPQRAQSGVATMGIGLPLPSGDHDRSFDVVDPETCVTMVTDEPAALLLSFKAVGSSR